MRLKKYLYILPLFSVMAIALPVKVAADEEVIVGDDDGSGRITAITLVWDRNQEPDIAGYNVYFGRTSGDYLRVVSVILPTATIKVRGNATVYFAATAYNTNGVESDLSEEVQWP
jgi:hypothetical protein